MFDLRELDEDSGVIRAVQCFFMEENEPRESNEEVTLSGHCLLVQYRLQQMLTMVTLRVRSIGFQ